ncbi:uncharacterized protein STEHIDRAFT_110159 [Stereum hirsutum FP-91666 SS1]|uniref:uncharacterized protein n=1 Tax=Stereum hirsutum (strain FP-91666) TaxID=721885 RepID=UPI000440DC7D|nr:uncharacterized protein STEHIDRAFT_110159 [Stereum hirsutum FP-91666 SS1]EIM88421.1 hypothetical protein STEHIDRAFT_110159 [Stereum hirsutum FP-91666 SS1]
MPDKDRASPSHPHNGQPASSDSAKAPENTSNKPPSFGNMSVPPLAPLEYLQSQRRGSITDPSLHLSRSNPSSTAPNQYDPFRAFMRIPLPNSSSRREPSDPAGSSSNTPVHHSTEDHMNVDPRPPNVGQGPGEGSASQENGPGELPCTGSPFAEIGVLTEMWLQPAIGQGGHPHAREPGSPRSQPHGLKRKMSHDRGVSMTSPEDIDPQLVGPGVPSMNAPLDGPAAKRRGSTIDSRGVAQLSIYDRRHSMDARAAQGAPPPPQWWGGERRDSSSSMFSSPSMSYGSPAFSTESPHGRTPGGPSSFAWHPSSDQQPPMPGEVDASGRPFDPNTMPPIGMVPSLAFNADRRMSVPTNLPSSMPPNSTTARVLRSRSRPPSRGAKAGDGAAGTGDTDVGEGESASSSNANPLSSGKDQGNTPYSRSPELRVSHKLAERKRRKEMKDLFDELRDQLPADRGMKATIDFIVQLKHSHQDMNREIEMLRHELDSIRQGVPPPPFGPGGPHPVMYGQGPPPPGMVPGHFPPPPGSSIPPPQSGPPPPSHQPPLQQQQQQQPNSRPGSSQNVFPPGAGQGPVLGQSHNGNTNKTAESTVV